MTVLADNVAKKKAAANKKRNYKKKRANDGDIRQQKFKPIIYLVMLNITNEDGKTVNRCVLESHTTRKEAMRIAKRLNMTDPGTRVRGHMRVEGSYAYVMACRLFDDAKNKRDNDKIKPYSETEPKSENKQGEKHD